MRVDPPKWIFSGDYIRPLGVLAPQILHAPQPHKLYFPDGLAAPGGLKLSSAPYF